MNRCPHPHGSAGSQQRPHCCAADSRLLPAELPGALPLLVLPLASAPATHLPFWSVGPCSTCSVHRVKPVRQKGIPWPHAGCSMSPGPSQGCALTACTSLFAHHAREVAATARCPHGMICQQSCARHRTDLMLSGRSRPPIQTTTSPSSRRSQRRSGKQSAKRSLPPLVWPTDLVWLFARCFQPVLGLASHAMHAALACCADVAWPLDLQRALFIFTSNLPDSVSLKLAERRC